MGEMFEDYEKLQQETIQLFLDKKQTFAIAESCTGGLISHLLTQIPGSSKVFKGSIVAYSQELKTKLLQVKTATVDKYLLESPEVTEEMAVNMRSITNSDVACATNGIAGPGPGQDITVPIGQVFIALASKNSVQCHTEQFFGRREEIKLKAAIKAITLLNDFIKKVHV